MPEDQNVFDFLPLNKSRATNEPQFRSDLGDLCHFNQFDRAVPVFVVTDLQGNILCGNNVIKPIVSKVNVNDVTSKIETLQAKLDKALLPTDKGGLNDFEANKLKVQIFDLKDSIKDVKPQSDFVNEWLITGVKSTVTRFFSCSTSTIMLTCDIADESMYTPTVPEALEQERDICIWGGFIESIRPITQKDLTTNLLRVYVGIIDTVQFTGSGTGGHTLALSCRDRLRWLMDTSNTFDIGSLQGDTISRSRLILQIAQKGIGFIEETNSQTLKSKGKNVTPKRIITKAEGIYVHDLAEANKTKPLAGLTDVPSFESIYLSNILDNTKNGLLAGNTSCKLEVDRDPAFYIYTSRVGISTQNTAQLMIRQQHPIDMIKTLTMQEVYPTDMFQSHVDGNFYYYPRAADYNSLNDPKRYFRTYFFRTVPSLQQKDLLNYPGKDITSTKLIPWKVSKDGNYLLDKGLLKSVESTSSSDIPLSGSEKSIELLKTNVNQPKPFEESYLLENAIVANKQGTRNFAFNDVLTLTMYVGSERGKDFVINIQDKIYVEAKSTTDASTQAKVEFSFNRNMLTEEEFTEFFVNKLIKVQATYKENTAEQTPNLSVYRGYFQITLVKEAANEYQTALLPPDPNQMLISLRYEQSSIGVFTNFILYKSNTQDQLVTTEWTMHLELLPEAFYGRDGSQIPIAKKFVRIEDPNVKTPAEGAAILLNAARVYARATQVAAIVINGDPSVTPGEIFQIFGSPLLVNDGLPKLLEDRNNYLKMKTLSIQSFQKLALLTSATNKENNGTATEVTDNNAIALLNTPGVTPTVTSDNYDKLSTSDKEKYIQTRLYNGAILTTGLDNGKSGDKAVTSDEIMTKTSSVVERKKEDLIPEPKTIFRVEAVSHKFNIGGSKGFTTEVSLTVPF